MDPFFLDGLIDVGSFPVGGDPLVDFVSDVTSSNDRWPLDLNVLPPFLGLLRYTWLRVWLTILKSKNRSQFWIQLAALRVLSARLNRAMSSSHAEQTRHDGHAEVLNEDTVPRWIWECETGPAEVLALVWGHVVLRRQICPAGLCFPCVNLCNRNHGASGFFMKSFLDFPDSTRPVMRIGRRTIFSTSSKA